MVDREKLIEQLENEAITTDKGYVEIPLFMFSEIIALLKEQEHKDRMYHALEDDWKRLKELLKEQEAVSIKTDYFDGFGNRTSHCPSCNSRLVWHQNKNYCGECGQAVKWE